MWRKLQEATIKHPKWGPSLSPSLLFTSFQWWQTFRRKNLYPISPLPLLGFPFFFFFTAGQVFCSLLHALPEQENAWQVLKAQGRVGTSPSRLPSSAKLPCTRSLFLKRAGSSSGQKTERRGGGLIWFIV